ncbi:GtrA family protein [Salinibacterium sp.]|uniref:GtrA family protein n=1 Tax=Salinibacterium sp. TaxID=1915057 RepID=UPI00286D52E8|nr:GtrA family protein [Salinibacterium sp.]
MSASVDAGVFLLLTTIGVMPVVASAFSFISAFVINYSGNRRVVFRASGKGHFWRYIALVIVNLGLSVALVALGVAIGLTPIVAKVVSIAVVAAFNYLAMRQWVFRDRPESSRA